MTIKSLISSYYIMVIWIIISPSIICLVNIYIL